MYAQIRARWRHCRGRYATDTPATIVDGPFFEELHRGQRFDEAPSITLTDGLAATHQAILGDRLRLALDHTLYRRARGDAGAGEGRGQEALAHPALVWDVAIGQSTVVTREVTANLFYRGLSFRRLPHLGDTLRTSVEVVGLRQNRPRPDRPATGLALLRITTVDQNDRGVLDFRRCAMLPLRDAHLRTGREDPLGESRAPERHADVVVPPWAMGELRDDLPGPHFAQLRTGQRWAVVAGDVVSSAPELARLTLNIAAVHHDVSRGDSGRLVYGGHTVGLALAQAGRALPAMLTVLAWESCEHLAPVREGDTLSSTLEVERLRPEPAGGGLVWLRSTVDATAEGRDAARAVLDWRFVALMA